MGLLYDQFSVGQRFRTPGRTITTGDIGAFAGLTGDYNPVHTDEVFAQATEFGQCVAHGPMGIGMAFGLAARLDLIDGTVVALLGVTWDFRAPMRPGDTIHAEIEVIETRLVRHPDRGLIGWSIMLANHAGTVLQQGTARLLVRRTALPVGQWGEVRANQA
jgi:acyl dehydratase